MSTFTNGSVTDRAVALYVDSAAANASDTNDGSAANPLITIQEAVNRIPNVGSDRAEVHVKTGLGAYAMPVFEERTLGERFWLIGDDFTEVAAEAAAQAGSSNVLVVTGGGLVANAFLGKTIEITSGAALGDRRTIHNNTVTNIVPSAEFSAAVADTDTFRILEPAVVITVADTGAIPPATLAGVPVFSTGMGGPSVNLLGNNSLDMPGPQLTLVNLRFNAPSLVAFSNWTLLRSAVTAYGVEFLSTGFLVMHVDENSLLQAGLDLDGTPTSQQRALAPSEAGLALNTRSWVGWGVAFFAGAAPVTTTGISRFKGYLVADATITVDNGHWRMLGGSVHASTDASFDVSRWSRVNFAGANPPFLVHNDADDPDALALSVRAGGNANIAGVDIVKVNRGVGLAVWADSSGQGGLPGAASVEGGSVSITGTTDVGAPIRAVGVSRGGAVDMRVLPTFAGFPAGNAFGVINGAPGSGSVVEQADAIGGNTTLPALLTSDGRDGWIRQL